MKRLLLLLMVLPSLLVGRSIAAADYVFTPLESFNPLAQGVSPNGINNQGQIVGENDATRQGFLLTGTTYTPLSLPVAVVTQAWGINDAGAIVGGFTVRPVQAFGFLYQGGNYTQLEVTLNGQQQFDTLAFGINNAGAIVGRYGDPGVPKGFVLSGGTYTTVNVPGSLWTEAFKINDAGTILGSYADAAGNDHGYVLREGIYTPLDVPGSTGTLANAINNTDTIVGYYQVGDDYHGFLWQDGLYTTLDVPGATATFIFGINDLGQLVGDYLDGAGQRHGFIAMPAPEPTSLLLVTVAVGSLLAGLFHARGGRVRPLEVDKKNAGPSA